jgi:hypothetical protein
MELIQLPIFPKCPICFIKAIEHEIICNNGHYLCNPCLAELLNRDKNKCPLCRQDIRMIKISNWCATVIFNIKAELYQHLQVNMLDKIDFLDNDEIWRIGVFIGFDLNSQKILIDPEYYNDNFPIKIPIDKNRIRKLNTMTLDWRNLNFFTNVKKVYLSICEQQLFKKCEMILCKHEKQWIESNIVYICTNTKHLLIVYHSHNNDANSEWLSFESKRIKIN